MSGHAFTAGQSSIWAQVSGPNTAPVYLGVHEIGDITAPEGDITLIYQPDEAGVDRYKVVNSIKGAAGAVTTDVTSDVMDEIDSLQRTFGAFTLFLHKSKKGRRDLFTNYDRSFVILNSRRSSTTYSGMSGLTPDDNKRSQQKVAVSGEALLRPIRLTLARQTIAETKAINDIVFVNEQTERTSDSPAQDSMQVGFAGADPISSATANVLYTSNGATWTATSTDPFAVDEKVIAVEAFEVARDTYRAVVGCGTTDAAVAAKIAYSDDLGVTWTNVVIGSVVAHFIASRHGLYARDLNNIWACTNLGYIHHSSDGGLTWTTQEAGVINTGIWNAIHFADASVGLVGGAANKLAKTVDGGVTWSTVSGPSAQSAAAVTVVRVLDRNRFWIGYDNGKLYYSLDAGVTWTQRSFTGTGVGQVRDLVFLNELTCWLLTNNASPVGKIHQSIDGGYTWEALTTPTNAGLNRILVGEEYKVFFCGGISSSLGFIGKGSL
jgi:photosystem II stability/assembly factor-like uncharacterized protein